MGLKEAYQDKADAQLREWLGWIEQLKSGSERSRSIKAHDQQRSVQRLEDCYRIAHVKLEELRASRDERWELAKQAVERAMIELKHALDESGAVQAGRFLELRTSRSHAYEPFHRKR